MDYAEIRALSLRLEHDTGHDSVATIERIYDRTLNGSYVCKRIGCRVARKQAVELWLHMHFGVHGWSFGVGTPDEIEEPDADDGLHPEE